MSDRREMSGRRAIEPSAADAESLIQLVGRHRLETVVARPSPFGGHVIDVFNPMIVS